MTLPPAPDPERLADECRETAALEHLQPGAVEKDFHLTRLIWGLADVCGDSLLLKGGTCLSKVDIGYHRMSEDADYVIRWVDVENVLPAPSQGHERPRTGRATIERR
jgi:hypothetical protein